MREQYINATGCSRDLGKSVESGGVISACHKISDM
jgi:hypothetical protein